MPIVQIDRNGRDGSVDLQVLQSGMDVTVKAGAFRVKGEDLTLTEDEIFSATANATYDTSVVGYLCKDWGDGDKIVLVVDEVLRDGIDGSSRWDSAAYKAIHTIFTMDVPAGAVDLDGVDIRVRKIVGTEA